MDGTNEIKIWQDIGIFKILTSLGIVKKKNSKATNLSIKFGFIKQTYSIL
jgi:hypothetical protein